MRDAAVASALTPHGKGLSRRGREPQFTVQQAREVRLSPQSHKLVAQQLGVSDSAIQKIRSGRTYGPLRPDERDAQRRRDHRNEHPNVPTPLDELVIGDPFTRDGLRKQDRQEMMDAAHECAHGRLPHDRTSACGCWPQEITKDQPPLEVSTNGSHGPRDPRTARFAKQAALARPNDRLFADRRTAA